MKFECKYKLQPCQYSDAWRCARAREIMDRVACQCPCHAYIRRRERAGMLTPDTLIKVTLTGAADRMTCQACLTTEPIPFEYLGASIQRTETNEKMSLVLTRAQRQAEIKKFKRVHLISCLEITGKDLTAALKNK